MRSLMLGVVLVVLALPLGAADAPATPSGFVGHYQAAMRARESKDYVAMETALREALKLRPVHPAATYQLAAALALQDKPRPAVDELRRLARMGLTFDAAGDADFAALRGRTGFDDVAADFRRNALPRGEARVGFTVPAPSFIPEGLAYDDDENEFFLGSVRQRRIERVREDGSREALKPAKPLWAVMGLAVDKDDEKLWAATSALPEMEKAEASELGRAAIVVFDLESGAEDKRYELPSDGRKHVIGDLLPPRDGKVYATDSAAGELLELDLASGRFTALGPAGAMASPQGLAWARGGRSLFVADYTQGLYRYDLRRRELKRLEVSRDICVYGIDGLYRYGDELVAVQNGVRPHRVIQLELERDRRVRGARVLASALRQFDEPALGVIDGDRFHFIANSQWGKFGKDHALPPEAELKGPVILRIDLGRREGEQPSRGPGAAPAPTQGPLPLPVPRL
ncbi:MAG TPA: hypothetical protein VM240_03925 [Verrucomicrobiae bacterium]|nr:hypothetical protein [Verrucomicrobiae bacterium]